MLNDVMLSVVKLCGVGSFVTYLTSNLFKILNQSVAKKFYETDPGQETSRQLN